MCQKLLKKPIKFGIGIGIGIGIEERPMSFGHEKLDVYRIALKYVQFSWNICENLTGKHRHARDQLLRASQSIPLNIAEGNGKATEGDRRRYFEIARGSALECAAVQDVLEVCEMINAEQHHKGKILLDRIVAMLTKLGGRSYSVKEPETNYFSVNGDSENDTDSDPDTDTDEKINR